MAAPLITPAAWAGPPAALVLAAGEVHTWRVPLDVPDAARRHLVGLLSDDERERAARFHHERDGAAFIAAHGALRLILGRYLHLDPAALRFRASAHGKPSLDGLAGTTLTFNLSHSHRLALIAVSTGREVGVDVEWMRADLADMRVAERFFSAHEVGVLRSLPAADRVRGFFNCWTRKEAYIKARGEGLSMPLHEFDVTLAPGEPARLLSTRADPCDAARWALAALEPGDGYAAAVAAEGQGWRLRCFDTPAQLLADQEEVV